MAACAVQPSAAVEKGAGMISEKSGADWLQTWAYREGRMEGRHRGPGVRSRRVWIDVRTTISPPTYAARHLFSFLWVSQV